METIKIVKRRVWYPVQMPDSDEVDLQRSSLLQAKTAIGGGFTCTFNKRTGKWGRWKPDTPPNRCSRRISDYGDHEVAKMARTPQEREAFLRECHELRHPGDADKSPPPVEPLDVPEQFHCKNADDIPQTSAAICLHALNKKVAALPVRPTERIIQRYNAAGWIVL